MADIQWMRRRMAAMRRHRVRAAARQRSRRRRRPRSVAVFGRSPGFAGSSLHRGASAMGDRADLKTGSGVTLLGQLSSQPGRHSPPAAPECRLLRSAGTGRRQEARHASVGPTVRPASCARLNAARNSTQAAPCPRAPFRRTPHLALGRGLAPGELQQLALQPVILRFLVATRASCDTGEAPLDGGQSAARDLLAPARLRSG